MDRDSGAAAAWDWRRRGEARRTALWRARRQGAIQGLVGAAAGAMILVLGWRWLGSVVLAMALTTGALGLLSPGGVTPRLQRFLHAFGRGVGTVVTWLLLVPFYYLVFTPFGLLFRRRRRDPMSRAIDRAAPSYWLARSGGAPPPESYRRQF